MIRDSRKQDLDITPQVGSDDEFGGLETPKKKSRLSLLLLLLCLVVVSGVGFFAYSIFLTEPDMPIPAAPLQPVAEAVPQNADAIASGPAIPDPAAAPDPALADTDADASVSSDPAAVDPATSVLPGGTSAEALPPPEASSPEESVVTETVTDTSVQTDANATTTSATTTTTSVEQTPPDPATGLPGKTNVTKTTATETKILKAEAPVPPPPGQSLDADAVAAPALPTPLAPLPATPSASPAAIKTARKTAETVAAVNDILGAPAIVTPAAEKALAQQVEVTSRASQVIIVKKTYSAQSPRAVNAAGDRVADAGQYGGAVEIYNRQLRNNPSDPLALGGKAVALQRAGRDKESMEAYQRLLSLNPRDVEALTNYLGLLQKQDPEQALTRLNVLEQQYPENAAVSGQTAMIYAGMMDTPSALRAFQKAATLDPTNPTYSFNMGVLYDRLGTVDKARDAYRQSLSLAQNYPEKSRGLPIDIIRERLRNLGQ